MISKIGFIGAGKVGTSLGRYFSDKGISISGYYSRSKKSSMESAELTGSISFDSIKGLVDSSRAVFITVPDGEIGVVWNDLRGPDSRENENEPDYHRHEPGFRENEPDLNQNLYNPPQNLNLENKYVIHCSGALSSEVFEGAAEEGAYACSLHPMCAVSDRINSWKDLDHVYFTAEGDLNGVAELGRLLEFTGNPVAYIKAHDKILYHTASVFVSNLVIGLTAKGRNLLRSCGLPEEFCENAWKSLFLGNADNMVNKGLTDALTGPVERGDYKTVGKHLAAMGERDGNLYKELSRMILDIAKVKHPERDYTKVEKELSQ